VIHKVEAQSKLDLLLKLLSTSETPLTKGNIYEQLWDQAPEFKDDLKKLTRLISRARSERGVEIKSRKGTYYVEIQKKIKAS
jgi:DNA-binding response OmpR family regulator